MLGRTTGYEGLDREKAIERFHERLGKGLGDYLKSVKQRRKDPDYIFRRQEEIHTRGKAEYEKPKSSEEVDNSDLYKRL